METKRPGLFVNGIIMMLTMKKIPYLPTLLIALLGAIGVALTNRALPETATVATVAPPTVVKEEGIRFVTAPWAKVLKQAKAEKKIIFFDAYAIWCGPCISMQKDVFTRPDVAAYFNRQFINVKVDVEQGEGPELAQRYQAEYLPTLLFIDGNGRVVKKIIGKQSADKLLAEAKTVK
jgi:thioredoxin 1